ncbi:MAG: SocA family protein [Chloroflexi bacterium]|nr:SocA family protein [Chloroflexota bacterium]
MPEFAQEKFEELVLYIVRRCQGDVHFGATKLNKVLFYSDFSAYKMLGTPITGAEYFALERGPAPKKLLPIQRKMVERGDIAEDRRIQQHRLLALRDPDLSKFTAQEIAVVDVIIDALRSADAHQVSELSHAFLGWQAAWAEGQVTGENVTIPYGSAFVSARPLDEFEQAHGKQLAAKHEWTI